jgi:hypothetical protein
MHIGILSEDQKERDYMEDPDVDGGVYVTVEGFCEHGNGPLGSIKCWEIPEWLSDRWLLMKGSASWS